MGRLVALLLLVLVVPPVHGQGAVSAPSDEARILTLEVAWNHAVQSNDGRALALLIAPEMVYVDYDGTLMNRDEYLAGVTSLSVHAEHVVSESMKVQVYGSVAVVNGVYRETGTKNGKPFVHRERFTDTWVRRGGSWLCVASQSTLISK